MPILESLAPSRIFYLDESGDLALFNSKRQMLALGASHGRSRFFMMGLLELHCPASTQKTFAALRADLLADPALQTIPSIAKTARFFHAKDDCPAVRRDVFNLIIKENHIKSITVAIRDKRALQQQGLSLFLERKKKISEKEIYQNLAARLLKNNLHKAPHNSIVFAERGKTTENTVLKKAVETAQLRFEHSHGIKGHHNHNIICAHPEKHIGLQLNDYCLWALQRLYERQEDYWHEKIKEKFKLIMDIDDIRRNGYGEWYSANNLLTLNKTKERTS
jgi:hypothetical protein